MKIISAVLLVFLIDWCLCLEREMTVSVEAGTRDCFYQTAKKGDVIDIDYQVIDGGHGDLDINFEMVEPNGRIIFADFKKSDNNHRHGVVMSGDYRFCFDNTISKFNRKTVFFEIIIENESEDRQRDTNYDELQGLTVNEFYDMKVQDIQDAIGRVRILLTRARQMQDFLRSNEARDRNTAEANLYRVNTWSIFQICMMGVVGGVQVFMVRSLFDTDAKGRNIWKRLLS